MNLLGAWCADFFGLRGAICMAAALGSVATTIQGPSFKLGTEFPIYESITIMRDYLNPITQIPKNQQHIARNLQCTVEACGILMLIS